MATLAAAGKRASSGTGSHVVLLREAGHVLRLDTALAARVDHMRRSRHGVFYEGDEISAADLRAALADATTVIDRAEATI